MSDLNNKPRFINAGRRGFMQGAAVAGGVAASGVAQSAETIIEPAQDAPAPSKSKGYQLTDHVRKYYQRARF
jgi:type III secretion system FlhB-like substrate exporter